MTFTVCRTSIYTNARPCKGAVKTTVNKRDRWVIEINALEELLEFVSRNGKSVCLFDRKDSILDDTKSFVIEIYDTYRE